MKALAIDLSKVGEVVITQSVISKRLVQDTVLKTAKGSCSRIEDFVGDYRSLLRKDTDIVRPTLTKAWKEERRLS